MVNVICCYHLYTFHSCMYREKAIGEIFQIGRGLQMVGTSFETTAAENLMASSGQWKASHRNSAFHKWHTWQSCWTSHGMSMDNTSLPVTMTA